MLPQEALVYPLYFFAKEVGLYNTRLAVIIIFTVIQSAFGTYLLASVLGTFPKALLEAAALDGASRWQILWRVVFPIVRPTLSVLLIFFFIWTWNEFFIPLVMLIDNANQTIPVALGVAAGRPADGRPDHQRRRADQPDPGGDLLPHLPAHPDPRRHRGRRQVTETDRSPRRSSPTGTGMQDDHEVQRRLLAVREGFDVQHPAQAHESARTSAALTVLAPTRVIAARGDTLNRPTATITLLLAAAPTSSGYGSSTTPAAGPAARFALPGADDPADRSRSTTTQRTLTSGALTARVAPRRPRWQARLPRRGGTVLTASGPKTHRPGDRPATARTYVLRAARRSASARRSTAWASGSARSSKNGQTVDIWNADGGTSSEQAYKNVPFYLTNRGLRRLRQPPGAGVVRGRLRGRVARCSSACRASTLEYFVIYGPTPKEVLAQVHRADRPPGAAAGVVVRPVAVHLVHHRLRRGDRHAASSTAWPSATSRCRVFHFDCFWMREFHWCDFEWDPRDLPRPGGHARAGCKAQGLRICVWINPYIAQRSRAVRGGQREAATWSSGPTATSGSGTCGRPAWPWSTSPTRPPRSWFPAQAARRCSTMGVDCFKTDFGERIPTDVVWHDGSDPERMHNYYTHLYNRTVFDLLEDERGEGEAVLFARSATAGGQQFPVHWGGDCDVDLRVDGRDPARRAVAGGLSGFGFWSHDIGGFEGTPDAGGVQALAGLRPAVQSHSRLHGSRLVPGAVGVRRGGRRRAAAVHPAEDVADAVPVRRRPRQAHATGTPMMRPMVLEFPDDPAREHLDRSTCSATRCWSRRCSPPTGRCGSTCPTGTWTHLLDGQHGHRAALGHRDARLRLVCRCWSGPARCSRSAPATTARTTTTPTVSRCTCSTPTR